MHKRGIFLIIPIIFTVLFFNGCLTTGDKVNMEELKRQLEAGGQAIPVTETAAVSEEAGAAQAAKPAEKAVAAAATAEETAAPAAVPSKIPVKTTVKKLKKSAAAAVPAAKIKEAKAAAVPAAKIKEAKAAAVPAAPAAENKNNIMFYLLAFAVAIAVIALIAFIRMRKTAVKDENAAPEPAPGIKSRAEEIKTGEVAGEYKTVEAEKPAEPGPAIAAGLAAATAAPAAEEIKEMPEEKIEEKPEPGGGSYGEQEPAAAQEAVLEPSGPVPVPLPGKEGQFGEGMAGVSPTQFTAGSSGNAVNILYKVGGDSPEYRTIRITVPDGWSKPGTLNSDEGYFIASVNSGKIISTAAEDMSMIIGVYGLPAEKGEVSITYGERRGGGPGVSVQAAPGQAVFKIETEARGTSEIKEIEDSPVVDVN
jgi:hypothetical protein